jgi:hypothetical protein
VPRARAGSTVAGRRGTLILLGSGHGRRPAPSPRGRSRPGATRPRVEPHGWSGVGGERLAGRYAGGVVQAAETETATTSARAQTFPPELTVHSTIRLRPLVSRTRARSSMGWSMGTGAR